MNFRLTDHRLAGSAWRLRYQAAFTTLLHFRLTVQTLSLPDDPVPEQLPEAELERFLGRLLGDLKRFAVREVRLLEGLQGPVRGWRMAELLPLLDLFDEVAQQNTRVLPDQVRALWRAVASDFVHLKALVVRRHVFG